MKPTKTATITRSGSARFNIRTSENPTGREWRKTAEAARRFLTTSGYRPAAGVLAGDCNLYGVAENWTWAADGLPKKVWVMAKLEKTEGPLCCRVFSVHGDEMLLASPRNGLPFVRVKVVDEHSTWWRDRHGALLHWAVVLDNRRAETAKQIAEVEAELERLSPREVSP